MSVMGLLPFGEIAGRRPSHEHLQLGETDCVDVWDEQRAEYEAEGERLQRELDHLSRAVRMGRIQAAGTLVLCTSSSRRGLGLSPQQPPPDGPGGPPQPPTQPLVLPLVQALAQPPVQPQRPKRERSSAKVPLTHRTPPCHHSASAAALQDFASPVQQEPERAVGWRETKTKDVCFDKDEWMMTHDPATILDFRRRRSLAASRRGLVALMRHVLAIALCVQGLQERCSPPRRVVGPDGPLHQHTAQRQRDGLQRVARHGFVLPCLR